MRSLHSALVAIRRSPYQSMLAIFMISLTFFVGYTFSMVIFGTELALQFFESRPQVIAFYELETEENEINALALDMKKKDYVEDVKLITKDEALKIYQEDNKENPLLLELVTADILPASIEVSANDIESLELIQEDLSNAKEIEDVIFQEDIIDSLNEWTQIIRTIGLVSIGVLGTISFLLIMVIISMKATTKRGAVRIMKIIGATNWYIISPFVTEGVLYGLFGSLIGWAGMYVLFLYLTPWMNEFLGSVITLPIPQDLFLWQLAIGTGIGIFLGALASSIAARRLVRR